MNFLVVENRIKEGFFQEFGPGELPSTLRKTGLVGGIVPEENSLVMAWVYKALGESIFPETYFILKSGESNGILVKEILSSFGNIKIDLDLVNTLKSKFSFNDIEDCNIDLSFLQFVSKPYLKSLKVVVLILNEFTPELGDFLSEIKEVLFLGLSALSSSYDGIYSGVDLVKARDDYLIKNILSLNEVELVKFCEKKKIDGIVIVMMVALMKLKFAKPQMLYHDVVSGLVTKGYAGFVFKS